MKLPIHAATITHTKGTSPYIASCYSGLISQIADYCRKHWSSVTDDPPPQNNDDLVAAYFLHNPDASLEVAEGGVDLPEPCISPQALLDFAQAVLAIPVVRKSVDNYEACRWHDSHYRDLGLAALDIIDKVSVLSTPSITRFTVFCQEAGCGDDTIHISTHAAADLASAILAGKQQCIKDWSTGSGEEEGEGESQWTMESVHCLGVAAGEVEILHWEEQPQ